MSEEEVRKVYVESPGYWVINPASDELEHSPYFPVFSTGDWIYADAPGTISIRGKKIVGFFPNQNLTNSSTQKKCPPHKPKEYVGFTNKFLYCEICDQKLPQK